MMTLLQYNLEKAGFGVIQARDGENALRQFATQKLDAVLLDWGLPSISGYEVCRRIRSLPEYCKLPVIMLTARNDEADKIRALDGGADDYVTKPFLMAELIARLHAILRRTQFESMTTTLSFEAINMDIAHHRVTRNERSIDLGPIEYRLLQFLLERPQRVFSREQMIESIWDYNINIEPRTIDVHISRLRKALQGPGERDIIRTIRSVGYALEGL